jgi:hypothetical protein
MPVFIKKYKGENYFRPKEFIDSIVLEQIPASGLPVIRFDSDNPVKLGSFSAGDFDIEVSLLQKSTSLAGKSVFEFFDEINHSCFLLVIFKSQNFCFCGIAKNEHITADFTYSQNKFFAKLTCKDILIEWANCCSASPNSSVYFPNAEMLSFEDYILRHFNGLTSGNVIINLPDVSLLERLKLIYPNTQYCYALGDYRNFIISQSEFSRWETFKELAKGIGFNFEMYLNEGTEFYNEPEFIFNIFFINDLRLNEPAVLNVIELAQSFSAVKLNWLFLKYRSLIFANTDYSSGIFFSSNSTYQSDTDNSLNMLYPCCLLNFSGLSLSYVNQNQITEKNIMRNIDFKELELKIYRYTLSTGRPIGKLHPIGGSGGADSGGMAYARIFNCARVHNVIDLYDFIPVQQFAAANYLRFLNSSAKKLKLKILLNDNLYLNLWKTVKLSNSDSQIYYISSLNQIDFKNHTAIIEITPIINNI